MMLRASVEAMGGEVDLRAVMDRSVDPLVDLGSLLMDLTDAVLLGNEAARAVAAAAIAAEGEEHLVDAAGVIGTFSMMNRIAEATGMPVGRGALQRTEEVRALTGIDRFHHG